MAVTLLGFGLRLQLVERFPLHQDEALYAYWARVFWEQDRLFLSIWPDKPPLFFVLLSASLKLLGTSPAASRILNIAIGTLTIPLVAAIAVRLWNARAGLIAAIAIALSPFAVSFSPTVFTDPLLVFAGMLGVYCALRDRPYWAGFWVGVAIMTKQQGLFYVPLVAGLLVMSANLMSRHFGLLQSVGHFLGGLLTTLLPGLYWDSLRWAVAPSPWDLALHNYGALDLLPIGDWPSRLTDWAPLFYLLVAGWAVWLLPAAVLAWFRLRRRSVSRSASKIVLTTVRNGASCRPERRVQLLLLWGVFFGLFHIVVSVSVWDRYLLPLTPLVALAIGRVVTNAIEQSEAYFPWRKSALPAAAAVAMILLPAAWSAAEGKYPIGGDRGALTGLHSAVAWLQAEIPPQAILYHRSLGWHYQFYLYDDVQADDIQLRWFPSEIYLVDNMMKAPHRAKYVMQPNWAPLRGLERHLQFHRFDMVESFHSGNFTIYELVYDGPNSCTWCLCELPPERSPSLHLSAEEETDIVASVQRPDRDP